MSIEKTRFEEIRKKYRDAKRENSNIDLLSLKSEVESFIKDLQGLAEEDDDLLAEAQDMLIDIIKMIEEGHCQPFRPKVF